MVLVKPILPLLLLFLGNIVRHLNKKGDQHVSSSLVTWTAEMPFTSYLATHCQDSSFCEIHFQHGFLIIGVSQNPQKVQG